MTLREAETLAVLLSEVPEDWPIEAETLCTCISCLKDYQARLAYAFPQFIWEISRNVDAPAEPGFGILTVLEREPTDVNTER